MFSTAALRPSYLPPPLPGLPVSNPVSPRAILDLKIQRDKLHQYQRRITILTDKETDIARRMLAASDKPRALLALRRKKYQESLLRKTDAQLEQLEQLTRNVEFALIHRKRNGRSKDAPETMEILVGDVQDKALIPLSPIFPLLTCSRSPSSSMT